MQGADPVGVEELLLLSMDVRLTTDLLVNSPFLSMFIREGRARLIQPGIQSSGSASTNTIELLPPEIQIGFGERFGYSVSSVPDLDGDNLNDVIIGAIDTDVFDPELGDGSVYVYSGADGEFIAQFFSPSPQFNSGFGVSVAGLPDINGDGRGDILIGASGEAREGGSGAIFDSVMGRAYVYTLDPMNEPVLRFTLEPPGDVDIANFGAKVIALEDTNDDSIPDFAVGAPRMETSAGAESGMVYVFSGADGSILYDLAMPELPINQSREGGSFGLRMDRLPDTNGDGIDDLIVGADYQFERTRPDEVGAAFLFSGADGELLHTFVGSVPLPEFNERFGRSVAGMQDVNGDGFGDVAISSPFEPIASLPGSTFGGNIYIYSGATGDLIRTIESPIGQDGRWFGRLMTSVGDFNGDGAGDLAALADYLQTDFAIGDHIVLINGRTGNSVRAMGDDGNLLQGYSIDYEGQSIAGLGDITGDGLSDLVLGNVNASTGGIFRNGAASIIKQPTAQLIAQEAQYEISGLVEYEINLPGGPISGTIGEGVTTTILLDFPIITELTPEGVLGFVLPLDDVVEIDTGIEGEPLIIGVKSTAGGNPEVVFPPEVARQILEFWRLF